MTCRPAPTRRRRDLRNGHALGIHLQHLRRHGHARHHALQAVDDDVFARLDAVAGAAGADDTHAVEERAELHVAHLRLAVGADHVDETFGLVGADGAVGHQHCRVRRARAHRQRHRQAGREQALGVVETGAHAHRAGLRIQPVVDEVDAAFVRAAGLVGQAHAHARCLFVGAPDAQEGLLADVEVGKQPGGAGDRRQHRLVVDQVAGGDVGARHASGDRRAHRRKLQVQPRGAQCGIGASDVGLRRACAGVELVELLPRHGLGVEQLLRAGQFRLRQLGARRHCRQQRFEACHFGGKRPCVDAEQQLALLHHRAVGEMHLVDGAGDARPQFDELAGFEPAAELLAVGHRALHRRSHAHRRGGWRAALCAGLFAAAGEHQAQRQGQAGTHNLPCATHGMHC